MWDRQYRTKGIGEMIRDGRRGTDGGEGTTWETDGMGQMAWEGLSGTEGMGWTVWDRRQGMVSVGRTARN